MKRLLLPLCLLALLVAACNKNELANTSWQHAESVVGDNGDTLSLHTITLNFLDEVSGHYLMAHVTPFTSDTDQAKFFYTYEDGRGQYSIYRTYDFEVEGATLRAHVANDTAADIIVFNKIGGKE